MADATDSNAVTPHELGDVNNVDAATTTVASIRGPLHKPTAGASDEFVTAARSAAIADTVALTGGEDPTEAEFNALQVKVNSVLAALRTHGLIAP